MGLRYRSKIVALAGMLFVILAPASQARDGDRPVAAVLDWFPFGWTDADHKQHGMVVDMFALYNAHLKADIETVVSPVPRVILGMEEGDFDFTITYRDTGMMSEVDYLGDIGCLRSLIISFRTAPVHSLEELNGLTVGYPGGGYFAKRHAGKLKLNRVEVPQNIILFKMAMRGRLNAFIFNDAVWGAYQKNLYPGFTVPDELWQQFAEPVVIEELHLAVSISRKSTQTALAERITALNKAPAFLHELDQIYRAYGLEHAQACLVP